MDFLRNTWYAAAWVDEIKSGTMFARTITDEPLVFWRDRDGSVSALLDRCPHRFTALSLGKCIDGAIECGYHGLRFDALGTCIGNPHGPMLKSLSVQAYPSVERHRLVWVWMGDPALADPALIPNMDYHDRAPDAAFNKGYLHIAASHHLMVDNILDLTHADYLHPDSLGNGWFSKSRARVEERGDSIFIEWLGFNETPTPLFTPEFPPGSLCDMWASVLWHPSGAMTLRSGGSLPGRPQEEGIDSLNGQIMTPETATSTHYFHSSTRTWRTDDAEYNSQMLAGLRVAFEYQDKPIIEAQQKRIGSAELRDLNPAFLQLDVATVRARRIYDRLIAEQRGMRTAAGSETLERSLRLPAGDLPKAEPAAH